MTKSLFRLGIGVGTSGVRPQCLLLEEVRQWLSRQGNSFTMVTREVRFFIILAVKTTSALIAL